MPSNTALGIGPKIDYSVIKTYNPYTFKKITVVLATKLVEKYFPSKNKAIELADYHEGDKAIPFEIAKEIKGSELVDQKYHQLMP